MLQTWESAFPGLVQPESSIPPALLPTLRYPQDLFDVQRLLLTQYHVADPSDFYNGADFWKVPNDPTVAATNTLNGGGTRRLLADAARRRTCRSPRPATARRSGPCPRRW